MQAEEDGTIDGHPAPTFPVTRTTFQLDSLHFAIGGVDGDYGSDLESILDPESSSNDDFLSNCQEKILPHSVELETVSSEPSQVDSGSVRPHTTAEGSETAAEEDIDESDTISETETEPSCRYVPGHGIQQISKDSQASIQAHATVGSDEYPESDTYPESDMEWISGYDHVHRIAQVELVLKRWNPDQRSRSQLQIVTMSYNYRLPLSDDMKLMCNYHQPTWLELRATFEYKMEFDSKADMVFIDDVGAARPSHYDQIFEERVAAMVIERLGYASPSDEGSLVYRIGMIFVNLTDPKAFMTYVRHSNPYIDMGVPYARKSPKDLHLIPPWQGDFMDLYLDHDRTLLAMVHGKHVTQVSTIVLTEPPPDPAPGTLRETDLLFVPPKDWAGGTMRENVKEVSVQVSCVAGSSNGSTPTEAPVLEKKYFLDKWNSKAFVDAWNKPVSGEGMVVKKLRLAQALLG